MTQRYGALLLAALFNVGCGDDHTHDTDAGHVHDHDVQFADVGPVDAPIADAGSGQDLAIRFRAQVGSEAFRCGQTYDNVGSMNSRWSALDFRFYVHDIQLVTASGDVPATIVDESTWQREGAALLDFEDGTGGCTNGNTPTNDNVRVRVPAGTTLSAVTGIRFTLGMPQALNHRNAAVQASPFNLTGMWWSWQGGYKFLRIDGRIVNAMGTPTIPAWNVHIGSTGCMGDNMGNVSACAQPNRATIALTGFDPSRSVIELNVARMLAGADLSRTQEPAVGCMSGDTDPDCTTVFTALGVRGTSQTAFSVFNP